jgi:hypothetical protein
MPATLKSRPVVPTKGKPRYHIAADSLKEKGTAAHFSVLGAAVHGLLPRRAGTADDNDDMVALVETSNCGATREEYE